MCAELLSQAFLLPLHPQQISLNPYLSWFSLAIGHSHPPTIFQYHRWCAKSSVCYRNETQRKYHIPIRNRLELKSSVDITEMVVTYEASDP